jgi:hemerythrin-like domain-containing protein
MANTAKKKSSTTRARARTKATKRTTRPRAKTKTTKQGATSLGKTAAGMLASAADAVRALVPMPASSKPATALLERQHREVEKAFATALDSEDARVRRDAMKSIIRQLETHTAIEETIFYPAVRALGTEQATDMVLEAYEEHHVVKTILAELPKLDPAAENFEAKMTVLKELVEHHVEEEEKEMFPMAERKLGVERSRELAEAMAARAQDA